MRAWAIMSSMSSPAQAAANRLNATKSTGPRSEVSAWNARKHGLRSDSAALLPSEDRGEWEALLNALRNEWSPKTPTEDLLVEKMAAADWRRRRAEHFEVGCLLMEGAAEDGTGMAAWRDAHKSQSLGLVVRYRRAAETAFTTAMHELERAQARRKGSTVPLPVAVDLNVTSDLGERLQAEE